MKCLGITQRVEVISRYNERRNCLDQRWSLFANRLGYFPLPLANVQAELASDYFGVLDLCGLLLSGGNSISSLCPSADDAAPERDAFELAIISDALNRRIPIIGICRGMQILNIYMGGGLSPIEGHAAVRHTLISTDSQQPLPETVNSYHNWSIAPDDLAEGLTPIATDEDGNIEAFQNIDKKLLGIMWHPEREHPFNELDIRLIESFLS
jgi:N5-(cytidine 5'-diphosphoramidyl)-L-glutamine hydrolase